MRNPPGRRGSDARDQHAARASDDRQREWDKDEDDPFRDLRPQEEETQNPDGDEYIWLEIHDGEEEGD